MLTNRFKGAIETGLERFAKWIKAANINNLDNPKIKINTFVSSDLHEFTENRPVLELASLQLVPVYLDENMNETTLKVIEVNPESYLFKGVLAINVSSHLLIEEGHVKTIEEAEEFRKHGIFMKFSFKYNLSGFIDSLDLGELSYKEKEILDSRNLVLIPMKGGNNND